MSARIHRFAAVCALAVCAQMAFSLDLTEGRLRLTLHEGIGRFSLSYLSNSRESAYTPLLVAQDPRTTALSIVVGNKVTRLGDGREFVQSVERTAEGARFVWKSGLLTVSQAFSFLNSEGASSADGVRIDLEVKNTSRQDLMVGLRYLFDTYLGEASFLHFRTDSIPDVTRELTLSGDALPRFWVSPLADDPEEIGMQVMTSGEGITVPDRLVFANWKRLNDASWSYPTSSVRNFNLLPYSVNDSAVCQYYEPKKLGKGTSMSVTLVLGKYNSRGFALKKPPAAAPVLAAAPAAVEPAPLPQQPAAPAAEQPPAAAPAAAPPVSPPPDATAAVAPPAAPPAPTEEQKAAARAAADAQADLLALNALIAEIDAALADGRAVSEADMARLKAALDGIRSRSAAAGSSPASTGPGSAPTGAGE